MINSRTFGPVQVRDLSESWSMDVQNVEAIEALTLGLPKATARSLAPTAESHSLVSPVAESKSTLHCSTPHPILRTDSSRVCHTTRIGARFSRVRGSTPSTVIYGADYRPAYSTPVVQRLDTVAA